MLNKLPSALEKSSWPWTKEHHQSSDSVPVDKPWPRISIITPSYNQVHFLEKTIRSVLLQNYPNVEYIIIDGGSSDGSVKIIKKYESLLHYWVSEEDRGQSHAINKGLSLATGNILHWLNADDYLAENALHLLACLYGEHPNAAAWVGGCQLIDTEENELRVVLPRKLERDHIANWGRDGWFYQPSCFFSQKAWQSAGPLDENLHFAMDFDLWLKLSKFGKFVSTSEIISYATIHPQAKTQEQRFPMHLEIIKLQIKHGYLKIVIGRLKGLAKPLTVKAWILMIGKQIRKWVLG